jgi:hypothetical protein
MHPLEFWWEYESKVERGDDGTDWDYLLTLLDD